MWVINILDAVNVDDTPVVETALFSGTDWSRTQGTERALYVTTRGWLKAVAIGQETIRGTLGCLMYLTDQDTAALQVATNGPWDAAVGLEDIVWMGGGIGGGAQATTLEAPRPFDIGETNLHVKAMRRVTQDQQIRLAMVVNVAGNAFAVSGVLRTLIRMSG